MANRIELTNEMANQLGGALARLKELASHKIRTAEMDAEQKGLQEFLANNAPQYLNELLACWFAVHNEYEPLVFSFASLLSRATAVIQQSQARVAQQQSVGQQPGQPEHPDNVVPLVQP